MPILPTRDPQRDGGSTGHGEIRPQDMAVFDLGQGGVSLGIVAAGGECVIVDLCKCGWERECEAALFGREAIRALCTALQYCPGNTSRSRQRNI